MLRIAAGSSSSVLPLRNNLAMNASHARKNCRAHWSGADQFHPGTARVCSHEHAGAKPTGGDGSTEARTGGARHR